MLFYFTISRFRYFTISPISKTHCNASLHFPDKHNQKNGYFYKPFYLNLLDPILSSQMNFRDLGGIKTKDGRKVKPGVLFRSGDFFNLSADDIGKLETLNLGVIIDFRAQREIDARPDKIIGTLKETIHIDIHDAAREKAEKFLQENDAEGLENLLIWDYIRMIREHQADFRNFLSFLVDTNDLPLVYHCAAGKDRTGLATLFLLTALGVDMEHIREDYMATNDYVRPFIHKIIRKVNASGLNGEILRPMLEVRKEYLDTALEEIEIQAGSLQHFVTHNLHANCIKLQENYLTE